MRTSLYGLIVALSIQTVGMGADALWHTVWHHAMRGEGFLHPWPHLMMVSGFFLTWVSTWRLIQNSHGQLIGR